MFKKHMERKFKLRVLYPVQLPSKYKVVENLFNAHASVIQGTKPFFWSPS